MTTLAYMRAQGETKRIPFGFSWTTLLFGFWPSVFRSHWMFVLMAVIFSSGAWFVSILVFQGKDAGTFPLGVRVLLASIRNHMLHDHMTARGWRIGRSALVIPFNTAANS